MGRWEPDARGRMRAAAIQLYVERGFDETTVADIAERAGVTERTFFRHFADKREVLFVGTEVLQGAVVAAIASAPHGLTPLETMATAIEVTADLLLDREWSRLRSVAIDSTPNLKERELLKMSSLGAASAEALRARGVPEPAATLAAESGVTIFHVSFLRWIGEESSGDLRQDIRDTYAQLKALNAR
ncbi:TetR/AcrR family transcriptional regulator [Leifsonia sp. NPDC058292]|uniref:TetR/AcrR family transcriptional regulator n=1 Tax=Leifsonia sp. NPDC058292 TaxID=3346428 RepID=UPI0036D7A972